MGESPIAARQGIAMVTMSRILMAAPGMVLIPMFMDRLEKKGVLARSNLMFSWHWQRAVTLSVARFDEILKVFDNFLRVYLLLYLTKY